MKDAVGAVLAILVLRGSSGIGTGIARRLAPARQATAEAAARGLAAGREQVWVPRALRP